MTGALGLVERIVREARRDEGGIVVGAGAVAVEADFPGCVMLLVGDVRRMEAGGRTYW